MGPTNRPRGQLQALDIADASFGHHSPMRPPSQEDTRYRTPRPHGRRTHKRPLIGLVSALPKESMQSYRPSMAPYQYFRGVTGRTWLAIARTRVSGTNESDDIVRCRLRCCSRLRGSTTNASCSSTVLQFGLRDLIVESGIRRWRWKKKVLKTLMFFQRRNDSAVAGLSFLSVHWRDRSTHRNNI